MRVGLAKAVSLAGLRVAGEVRDLAEAAGVARQQEAGLVVVGDTDETTSATLRRLPAGLMVVALVRQATRDELASLLAAGVAGVSLRSSTPEELCDILRRALDGERAVAQALVPALAGWSEAGAGGRSKASASRGSEARSAGAAAGAAAEGAGTNAAAPSDPQVSLTSKEREVLIALAAGATNQQIAAQLFVSPATVKTHLAHIYVKLDVGGRHEALSRAVALGIVH